MAHLKLIAAALAATSLTATAMVAPAIAEEAQSQIGPIVGTAAPSLEGTVIVTPEGAVPAGGNGTVLVFFRSADWCPFCKTQLKELNDIAAPLSEAGWGLMGVSYDNAETLSAFAAENDLTFPLLSDEDSELITAFQLLNTDVREGSRTYGIPHPAVVFVKADGTVGAVLREDGFRTRPSLEAISQAATLLSAVEVN